MNDEQFWAKYAHVKASSEFKHLISGILAYQPSSRPTIADILGDPWMRGPVMSKEDFAKICKPIVARAVKCQETELKEQGIGIDYMVDRTRRSGENIKEKIEQLEALTAVPFGEYEPIAETRRRKCFTMTGTAVSIITHLFCSLS